LCKAIEMSWLSLNLHVEIIKRVEKYGMVNPCSKNQPVEPHSLDYLVFERISVDELSGKPVLHERAPFFPYRMAASNAMNISRSLGLTRLRASLPAVSCTAACEAYQRNCYLPNACCHPGFPHVHSLDQIYCPHYA